MSSQSHNGNHYYVPNPVAYPVIMSAGLLTLATGFIFNINNFAAGKQMMMVGALVIIAMIFKWMGAVISECQNGLYKKWEDKSFRVGMIVFICSEIAFFAAFFGALFFMRVISIPELASYDPQFTMYKDFTDAWPSAGPGGVVLGKEYVAAKFNPMAAWGLPAINTFLLLTSGATVTWAHWGLMKNNRKQLVIGLFLTVALGIAFLLCQAAEYHEAYTEMGLTLGAGAYGASFFMLTGFHGFHVMLGTLMLIVILFRSMKGHFDADHHFGFEGVAWYWHFVDVVWLGLFVFVYWL
jgi:cytochrome c oxidase subunit 3